MNERATTDVHGWVHSSLQGEEIDGNVPVHARLSETATPVVVNDEFVDQFEPSPIELFRVSPNHGRSYELGPNARRQKMARLAIWRDSQENGYTSYSLKGNNFSQASVFESSTAPSGYIPMGLLESDALLRVIRSSRLLREAGISTEWINRVFEPKQLIYRGDLVSQAEYKQRLLEDVANERGIEALEKIAPAIEPMTFFITGRSMEINDRLADFRQDTPEAAMERTRHIFKVYNALHKEDEDFRPLRYDRLRDRVYFFRLVYPQLLGENVARLHNLDLVHTFPTISNVTILGGLIDLDSIKGVPLGFDDSPVTEADRMNDIATVIEHDDIHSLRTLYNQLATLGIIQEPYDYLVAQLAFMQSYEAHRKKASTIKQRNINTLYLAGADLALGGDRAIKAYDGLSRREAMRFMMNNLYQLRDFQDWLWSKESLNAEMTRLLDSYLRVALSNRTDTDAPLELNADMLIGLFKKDIGNNASATWDTITRYAKAIVEQPEQYPKLLESVPENTARLKIVTTILRRLAILASDDFRENHDEAALEAAIELAAAEYATDFLSRMKESDWQSFVAAIDGFDFLQGVAPNTMTVLHQKSVFAFGSIPLETIVREARKQGYPVTLHEHMLNLDFYNVSREGDVPRAVFTDGDNPILDNFYIQDQGYGCCGIGYKQNDTPTYAAWLSEPKTEDDTPHLLICHRDMAEGRRLINQYLA